MGELYKRTANIRDGNVIFFVPPTVSGFGSSDGFELRIKDNTGGPVTNLDKVSQDLVAALSGRDELAFAVTSFSTNFPQYMIEVDIAKCKQTGVDVNSLFATLQGYIGGAFSSDFNKFGKQYRIILQADADYRKDESSLAGIFTKNNAGEMVPVSGLVRLKKFTGRRASADTIFQTPSRSTAKQMKDTEQAMRSRRLKKLHRQIFLQDSLMNGQE